MSKFLALGMPLEEVVARATVEPAKVIGRVPGLGTLQVGAPADLAIMDLVDGPVEFVDTRNNKRTGPAKARAVPDHPGRTAVRPAAAADAVRVLSSRRGAESSQGSRRIRA